MEIWKTGWRAGLAAVVVAFSIGGSALRAEEARDVTEIFRVSNVGRSNVAESRELLMEVYALVEKDYNAEVAERRAALEKAYRGDQVRVIKKLGESDANGDLYLCAYKGEPSVFSIAGEPRKVGELTPPLSIDEDGTRDTEMTRTIVTKAATAMGKPALEEADTGGAVTFFGIPLVFDDGPSPQRPAGKKRGKSKSGGSAAEKKEVTEVKTLKKYKASVSTDQLEDGPPMLSTSLFLDLVKNGNVYQVEREERRLCQECRGWGRVTDTMNRKEPDGKMNCPDCAAAGKLDWNVTYVVAW